ncbi:hypothetical protein IMZ48_07055 [Candidatus Bathyarchaeota archaeon]|nr:hypothetical protein [Candidatus Bathyarchaeota archaeon]
MKDMRFQALMPDILHWLGIKKIDRRLSMSKSVTYLSPTVWAAVIRKRLTIHPTA